ncbi:hypothetical protein BH23THE1_BH23THE1_30980 [soil metagenome]
MIKYCFKQYQELYEVSDTEMITQMSIFGFGFCSIASTTLFVVFPELYYPL